MKDPSRRLELAGRLALEKVEVVECERLPRARRAHASRVVNMCEYYDDGHAMNLNNGGNLEQDQGGFPALPGSVPARSGRVVTLSSGGIFAVTGSPVRFYDMHGEYLYSLEEAGHIRGGRMTLLHPRHVIATLNRDRRLMTWSISPAGSVRYLSSYRLNLNPHRSSSVYRSSDARSRYHYDYDYRSPQHSNYQGQFHSPFDNAMSINININSHLAHSHHPTEMIAVGSSLLLVGDNLGNVHLISHNNGRNLRPVNIQLNGIHSEKICYLATNHADKFAVSSKDGIISVWSISKNNIIHCIGRLPTVRGIPYRVDMNDDYLVAAGNGELRIYDLNSASISISKIITNAYNCSLHDALIISNDSNVSRSPILKIFGGHWVIVGGGGKTLSILNIHTAKAIASILTPFERVRALDFTRDNKLVVTSVDTGGLALLDLRIPRNVYRDLREWTKAKFNNENSSPLNNNGEAKKIFRCTTHDETSDEDARDDNDNDDQENRERSSTNCGNNNNEVDSENDEVNNSNNIEEETTNLNGAIDNNNNLDSRRRRVLQATSSIAIAALGCLVLKCGRRFLSRT